MSLKLRLVSFVLLLLPNFAVANTNLYMGLAPTVPGRTHLNNLYEISLGDACNVMLGLQQVLPCNPAFIGEIEGKSFQASFMTGDDQNFVTKGTDLLNDNKTYDFAKALFDKDDMVDTESTMQLSFRYNTVGLEIIPFKRSVWVLSRDSSNPRIAVQIKNEQSVAGTIGGHLTRNHAMGLKLRYIHREVIQDEFSFLQAAMSMDDLLNTHIQNAISIEPGYAYFVEDDWRTRFSATIKSWEITDKRIDGVYSKPQVIWGLGATPYDKAFTWDIGLTHKLSGGIKDGFTLTSQTHFDYISWFSMLAFDRYSVGGSFLVRDVQMSLSFTERHYNELDEDLPLQQSFQLEASYVF